MAPSNYTLEQQLDAFYLSFLSPRGNRAAVSASTLYTAYKRLLGDP
jgi:hypothetical protein